METKVRVTQSMWFNLWYFRCFVSVSVTYRGIGFRCWLWFLSFSSCGGDGRVTCGISTIPRVSRSLLSKGPSLSLESLEDVLSCSDSATFCHVLSTCQCFHTHPFHEDLRSNVYTSLRILPRFLSLWLLFRRALCQRRPRRRVGCSGQAVPCLVLRRFQQAVLVYMRSCWCMLINGHPCWC